MQNSTAAQSACATATPLELARWMMDQLTTKGGLYHRTAVRHIRHHYGDLYLYLNANGNPAISKNVLNEFRLLAGGTAMWQSAKHCWRLRGPRRDSRVPEAPEKTFQSADRMAVSCERSLY
jgi:hypothetical protein